MHESTALEINQTGTAISMDRVPTTVTHINGVSHLEVDVAETDRNGAVPWQPAIA